MPLQTAWVASLFFFGMQGSQQDSVGSVPLRGATSAPSLRGLVDVRFHPREVLPGRRISLDSHGTRPVPYPDSRIVKQVARSGK